jgi:translation initiation factor 2 subunit 3
MQPELNIGLFGHVDHGKTTLCESITGTWTDTHSIEIKRGITIKLGYADFSIRKCESCGLYTTSEKCERCGGPTKFLRKISFVDAPGHESLMTTAIASANIIDGAILVIAANEPCPQPQTKEHLMVLETLNIKNVVIAQTKIDLVERERAIKSYEEIKAFLEGTAYESSPIIPVSAFFKLNLNYLLEAIEKVIPTPQRDLKKSPLMAIARSFDVNKPGTPIEKLIGGVIGGSLICGKLSVGDEIRISPPIVKENREIHLKSKVSSLYSGKESLEEAKPGGLIAIGTSLDPSLTKADGLVGSVVSTEEIKPVNEITFKYSLFDRVDFENEKLSQNEMIVVCAGTTVNIATISSVKGNTLTVKLKKPMCIVTKKLAILRKVGQRWRLCGTGELV